MKGNRDGNFITSEFSCKSSIGIQIKIYNHFKLQVPRIILLATEVSNLFLVLFSLIKLTILRTVRVCCGQYVPPPEPLYCSV